MKKLSLIILIIICYSTTQAQFIKNVGVKTGATISRQMWKYAPGLGISIDPDSKIGFNAGVFAEFLNLPFLSFVAEVNYVEKGMQLTAYITPIDNPDGGTETVMKAGVNYLNLSLLAKVRLEGVLFTPYIIAGPKVDFEISRNGQILGGTVFDDYTKSRFGFKVGGGTEIKVLNITFLAEILYDSDFGNLFESSNLKITTSAVDLRAGVSLGL